MNYEEQFVDYVRTVYNERCRSRDLSFAKIEDFERNLFPEFYESDQFEKLLLGNDTNLFWESDDDELYALPKGPTGAQVSWWGHWDDWPDAGHFEFRFPYREAEGGYQCLVVQGGYEGQPSATRYVMMNRYLQTGYEGHERESVDMTDERWEFVLPKIETLAGNIGIDLPQKG